MTWALVLVATLAQSQPDDARPYDVARVFNSTSRPVRFDYGFTGNPWQSYTLNPDRGVVFHTPSDGHRLRVRYRTDRNDIQVELLTSIAYLGLEDGRPRRDQLGERARMRVYDFRQVGRSMELQEGYPATWASGALRELNTALNNESIDLGFLGSELDLNAHDPVEFDLVFRMAALQIEDVYEKWMRTQEPPVFELIWCSTSEGHWVPRVSVQQCGGQVGAQFLRDLIAMHMGTDLESVTVEDDIYVIECAAYTEFFYVVPNRFVVNGVPNARLIGVALSNEVVGKCRLNSEHHNWIRPDHLYHICSGWSYSSLGRSSIRWKAKVTIQIQDPGLGREHVGVDIRLLIEMQKDLGGGEWDTVPEFVYAKIAAEGESRAPLSSDDGRSGRGRYRRSEALSAELGVLVEIEEGIKAVMYGHDPDEGVR